jgi:hypothetical protein
MPSIFHNYRGHFNFLLKLFLTNGKNTERIGRFNQAVIVPSCARQGMMEV